MSAFTRAPRCLISSSLIPMDTHPQFRRILPIAQTALAIVFGSWGLFLRKTIISTSQLGWNSTLRFHVWPWPLKFAVIQNAPALIVGSLMSIPIAKLWPEASEWFSYLPSLFLVPLLWWLIGSWVDRECEFRTTTGRPTFWPWILLSIVTIVSLLGAVLSEVVSTSYTAFVPFAIALWIILGIGMRVFNSRNSRLQRRTR